MKSAVTSAPALLFSQVARMKDDHALRRENRCGETSTTTN